MEGGSDKTGGNAPIAVYVVEDFRLVGHSPNRKHTDRGLKIAQSQDIFP